MESLLVYDGSGPVRIPPSMGEPLPDQVCGTDLENLGEVASRICYDSLGLGPDGKRRGRSAVSLHAHILEVKNLSVLEHCTFTVRLSQGHPTLAVLMACVNRKGVRVDVIRGGVEITVNFRAVLEWGRVTDTTNEACGQYRVREIGQILRHFASGLAPTIFGSATRSPFQDDAELVRPADLTDDQAHVSLYLRGSRGFTHEQVRHRFAMSQRSTRYCDESISEYVIHPLIEAYCDDFLVPSEDRDDVDRAMADSMRTDRFAYKLLVEKLQAYCESKGLDRTSARKQARGAARGYLGNALESEMIFTAPVSGWKWMLRQRKNALADAEIREVYTGVLSALKGSRYGERFLDYDLAPSPDGIGTVLVLREYAVT